MIQILCGDDEDTEDNEDRPGGVEINTSLTKGFLMVISQCQ